MAVNAYAWFILVFLLLVHGVQALAEVLNVGALRRELPEDFRDVFDPARYARAREYGRARTLFGMGAAGFHLAVFLGFWFCGGFAVWDEWLRARVAAELPRGLAYVGGLFLADHLLGWPWAAYGTFVIEQRFGFNRMTWKTFLLDRLKAGALVLLLGGPLLAGVLAFLRWAGPWGWAYAWGASALFMIFLQALAPSWIMPLFNKFTPLEDGELRRRVFQYAESVRFPLKNIFVMDGSRRSAKTNAFFTGFGKNKRIALFDTLIQKHSTDEMVAVLAHEIGHYKQGHVMKGMVFSFLQYGALFYLLSVFLTREGLFRAFGLEASSVYAGLVFFGYLYSPAAFLLSVLRNVMSRRHEWEADRWAADTVGDPAPLARALKTLSAVNLSALTPHPFHVFLNDSHPPVAERLAALRRAG